MNKSYVTLDMIKSYVPLAMNKLYVTLNMIKS